MSEKEKKDLENTELDDTMELDPEEIESVKPESAKQPAKAESAKKNKPAEKKAKSGSRISRYLREMRSELKKVAWPGRKQTINNTGVVIVCVIVVGAFVWIFDGIAGQLIGALLNLFGR